MNLKCLSLCLTSLLVLIVSVNSDVPGHNVVIDLSHWNKNVDFEAVKEDGIFAVIHKATEGDSSKHDDAKYHERKKQAKDAGLLWGAYHFGTNSNGTYQAQRFLKYVFTHWYEKYEDEYWAKLPLLVLDVEPSSNTMTLKTAEDFVSYVLDITGVPPILYGGSLIKEWFSKPRDSVLEHCSLWLSHYSAYPVLPKYGWKNYTLWQYTDGKEGPEPRSVKGVGPCDRNTYSGYKVTSGLKLDMWDYASYSLSSGYDLAKFWEMFSAKLRSRRPSDKKVLNINEVTPMQINGKPYNWNAWK